MLKGKLEPVLGKCIENEAVDPTVLRVVLISKQISSGPAAAEVSDERFESIDFDLQRSNLYILKLDELFVTLSLWSVV